MRSTNRNLNSSFKVGCWLRCKLWFLGKLIQLLPDNLLYLSLKWNPVLGRFNGPSRCPWDAQLHPQTVTAPLEALQTFTCVVFSPLIWKLSLLPWILSDIDPASSSPLPLIDYIQILLQILSAPHWEARVRRNFSFDKLLWVLEEVWLLYRFAAAEGKLSVLLHGEQVGSLQSLDFQQLTDSSKAAGTNRQKWFYFFKKMQTVI